MKKKVAPPVLFLVCLVVMIGLHWLLPVRVILRYPLNLVGLVPMLAGWGMGLTGVAVFRRQHTNIHPFRKADVLVTTGVYGLSRNPMYLCLSLVLFGTWLLLGAITPVAGALAFAVIIDRWYIPAEEQMLSEQFGEVYEDYRRRVRRWL